MSKGRLVLALFLILLGAYLLLEELGVGVPGWDAIWPVFPLAGGLVLAGSHFLGGRRDPGRVMVGTAAALVGVLFFFVTLGPLTYADLEDWWPLFVLIASAAFAAQWAAARFRDWGAAFLSIVALVIGLAGLAVEFSWFGPETSAILPNLWPVLLIAGGLMLLLRGMVNRRP